MNAQDTISAMTSEQIRLLAHALDAIDQLEEVMNKTFPLGMGEVSAMSPTGRAVIRNKLYREMGRRALD